MRSGHEGGSGMTEKAARPLAERQLSPTVAVEVYQHDWLPGFAAFHDNGQLDQDARAHVVLNLGALLAAVAAGDLAKDDLPYVVAESLMHEVVHVLEAWAGAEFNHDRIDELFERYRQRYRGAAAAEEEQRTGPRCAEAAADEPGTVLVMLDGTVHRLDFAAAQALFYDLQDAMYEAGEGAENGEQGHGA